jgi:hypothetical protein
MDSRVVDVAIGLVFTFAVVAALGAVLSEVAARALGLRARYLLLGLRELLDDRTVTEVHLANAPDTFTRFTDRAAIAQAWGRWATQAAIVAPHVADWDQWAAQAGGHEALTDRARTTWLTPEQRTAWASAAARAGRALATRSPAASDGQWQAWACECADDGRRRTLEATKDPQATLSVTEALLGAPIMATQGMPGCITSRPLVIRKQTTKPTKLASITAHREPSSQAAGVWAAVQAWGPLRGLPAYAPARSISAAVFDLVVPNAAGTTTLDDLRTGLDSIPGAPAFTGQLQSLLRSSGSSVEEFRTAVENWYDDHMDRVSGWYKRHIGKWTLVIGGLLVLALNINSVTIARTLYSDQDVRTAVTAIATQAADCQDQSGDALTTCLQDLEQQLQNAQEAGLPLGWGIIERCQADNACASIPERYGLLAPGKGWVDWHPLLILVGWLITILALVPGSRFWFDLLGKAGSLRSTGPKPTTTSPSA